MKTILVVIALISACAAYYFYDGKTAAEDELESKVANISKDKEKEIAQLKSTYNEFAARLKKEIEQGQIKIIQLSDRLSVIMVDKILFPSGEAEITPEGLTVLEQIGGVLKNTQNKTIRVEGHTDNVQINKKLKKNTQPIGSFQRRVQQMLCDFCRKRPELYRSFCNPLVCQNIIQSRAMKHRTAAVRIVVSRSLCCRNISLNCASLQLTSSEGFAVDAGWGIGYFE